MIFIQEWQFTCRLEIQKENWNFSEFSLDISDFSVYGVEVEMILDEIISTEEVPDYPVSQMLSDFGGVFGFCMGLSLLTFINAIEWAFKSVFKVKNILPRVKFGWNLGEIFILDDTSLWTIHSETI